MHAFQRTCLVSSLDVKERREIIKYGSLVLKLGDQRTDGLHWPEGESSVTVYGRKIMNIYLAWLSLGRLWCWAGNWISETALDDYRYGDPHSNRQNTWYPASLPANPGMARLNFFQSNLPHLFNEDKGNGKDSISKTLMKRKKNVWDLWIFKDL